MRYFVLLFAVLAACVTPLDLSPRPVAGTYDPVWIHEFDARLMEKQDKAVTGHRGSVDSKIILWNTLECMRRVSIAQVRSAQALTRSEGMTRRDALSKVMADPTWFIATERCR